jgi:hypothetical protein
VQAKGTAWQTYTMQVRNILTNEQYQVLQQEQAEHRNALLNQLKGDNNEKDHNILECSNLVT